MDSEVKEYLFVGQKGVHDLKSQYPYHGEWSTFSSYYDVTEEQYLNDPTAYQERIKKDNEQYISELKEKGEFKDNYTVKIQIPFNKEFDSTIESSLPTLESYQMLIYDYGKE
jgi:hypothetical protein